MGYATVEDGVFTRTRSRKKVTERVVKGFPLSKVNMTAPVSPEDFTPGSVWPNKRIEARVARLQTYDDLFDGDITKFVGDSSHANLPLNYFERISTVITAILMTSDPLVSPDAMQAVRMMLSDASLNALRSGRAYMVREDEAIGSPETITCFDGEDGTVYTIQYITTVESDDGAANQVEVKAYSPEGSVETRLQAWNSGTFGDVILEAVGASQGAAGVVDRSPRRNGFGRSIFDIIGPPVVATSLRMSGVDYTIAQNQNPLMTVPIANADVGNTFEGLEGKELTLADVGKPKIVQEAAAMRDHDVLWTPDGVGNISYVEWGATSMDASFKMLDMLAEEISMFTGLSRALIGGSEMPSGVAMKRLLFILYADTKLLKSIIHDVAQQVYGAFEWPHPFDIEEVEDPLDDEDSEDDMETTDA